MSTNKTYALHSSTHLLKNGTKIYVNAKDLVDAYNIKEDEEYVFWDPRKHKDRGQYIHLHATVDILQALLPDEIGEFSF